MTSTTLDLLACLVAAASLGAMLFFSAVIAPTVFKALPPDHAGTFLRRLFPSYFLLNGVAALVCAGLARQVYPTALFALAGMVMLAVWALLIPRINAARDGMIAGDAASGPLFHRLHSLSVGINLLDMACLVIATAMIAAAR